MDLNFSYFQHQISLMRAAGSKCSLLRTKFLSAADDLANQIGTYQRSKGATAAGGWLRISEDSNPQAGPKPASGLRARQG
jgi:hypothetical protein